MPDMQYFEKLKEFTLANKDKNDVAIATEFIKKYEKGNLKLPSLVTCGRRVSDARRQLAEEGLIFSDDGSKTIAILEKKEKDKIKVISLLSKKSTSIEGLAEILKKPVEYVDYILNEIRQEKYNLLEADGYVYLETSAQTGGFKKIDMTKFHNKIYRIGAVSDNHLNSKFERLDVLNAIYDVYEKEGITDVYNAGNWIEGDARFNRYEVKNSGASKQVDYFVNVYPQRKNLVTHFIAGDDHEGWYWQREGLNIGEYAEMKALKAGREDLKYLGYVEADIEFQAKKGSAKMRVMHPGGGSAYAVSYSPQKMIECVPLYSEILTKTGWKKYNNLTVGEFVMGYNINTGKCEWTKLKAINKYKNAEVVKYKNEFFEVECTREHKWVLATEARAGKNINSLDPTPYNKKWFELNTIDSVVNNWRRIRLLQSAICPDGDGYSVADLQSYVNKKITVQNVLKMTSEQRKSFIYGMMIGEGSLSGSGNTPVFSQSPNTGDVLDGFNLACFMEGISLGIYRETSKKIDGNEKICCRAALRQSNKRMVSKSMNEVSTRSDDVWCPTTELGTWVMKQNSVITITGNSFQGGEKPHILLLGHYHKADYFCYRDVHCVQLGTTQDQSTFMRKKKLQAHVGGWILEFQQSEDGSINRFKVEWLSFFNNEFYDRQQYYI